MVKKDYMESLMKMNNKQNVDAVTVIRDKCGFSDCLLFEYGGATVTEHNERCYGDYEPRGDSKELGND